MRSSRVRLSGAARRLWRIGLLGATRILRRSSQRTVDSRLAPLREARLTQDNLLQRLAAASVDSAWEALQAAPFPAVTKPLTRQSLDAATDDEPTRILAAAEAALAREVKLLGAGPFDVGTPVAWHTDFRTGVSWPPAPFGSIDLEAEAGGADIRVPWHLSRLQWLIPVGQAYLLTGEERYAAFVGEIVDEWLAANPLGIGVNWNSTMDVGLRAVGIAWLARSCAGAASWRDADRRFRILKLLYLHGDFVERHLEWSSVGDSRLAAGLATLVVLGHLFDDAPFAANWRDRAWERLEIELVAQVTPDGVSFEASASYHRLAMELFMLAAAARRVAGYRVPPGYALRLERMAAFVASYCGGDGRAPKWGDVNDERVLPFGGQAIDDHRYLIGLAGVLTGSADTARRARGPRAEAAWWFGVETAAEIADDGTPPASAAFPDGGAYVLRHGENHVFVDAGRVGARGRGGHGHNDCLAFEATLDGVPLIIDCGSVAYGADLEARNRFRATAAHNTPQVDGREINRFAHPSRLLRLIDDARPRVLRWSGTGARQALVASHTGYRRFAPPVTPLRAVVLDHRHDGLVVHDRLLGHGRHAVRIPFHLAPGVRAGVPKAGRLVLDSERRRFVAVWREAADWTAAVEDGWMSPADEPRRAIRVLSFRRRGPLVPLTIGFFPADRVPADPEAWLAQVAAEAVPAVRV